METPGSLGRLLSSIGLSASRTSRNLLSSRGRGGGAGAKGSTVILLSDDAESPATTYDGKFKASDLEKWVEKVSAPAITTLDQCCPRPCPCPPPHPCGACLCVSLRLGFLSLLRLGRIASGHLSNVGFNGRVWFLHLLPRKKFVAVQHCAPRRSAKNKKALQKIFSSKLPKLLGVAVKVTSAPHLQRLPSDHARLTDTKLTRACLQHLACHGPGDPSSRAHL